MQHEFKRYELWRRVKPIVFLKIPFVLTNLSWEDLSIFWGVFNKIIIPLALVGYELIIANLTLWASLAICHLTSNVQSRSDC